MKKKGKTKAKLNRISIDLFRPYWRCYYSNTDAIIYVVDSADRDRIGISKDELLYMLKVRSTSLFKLFYFDFLERLILGRRTSRCRVSGIG